MFALENQTAKLKKLTTRTENHGPDKVPAASVELAVTAHSSILDLFHPSLRRTFFGKAAPGEQQSLALGEDDQTAIAIPEVKALDWDGDYPGYRLELGVGLESSTPLVLTDVTLRNFRFEFVNGGSVITTFSAGGTPDGDQVGDLYEWQGKDLQLTLVPPTKNADLFPADGESANDAGSEPRGSLVVAIDVEVSGSTHLHEVTVTLAGGRPVKAGEWAYRPTIDEIAGGLHDVLGGSIEFTPAARAEFELKAAA